MKLVVTCVFDSAIAAFTPPQCFRTKGEALRAFADACADQKGNFFLHSKDYTLMQIGEYDDVAGLVVSFIAPERLVSASECVADNVVQEGEMRRRM